MYIPWGRKLARVPAGRVADFCPLCRDFRPFRLLRVESVRHFYYQAYGEATPIGFAKACETCGRESGADPSSYRATEADPDAPLDALIAATNPEIARTWASRLMVEARAKAGKLGAGERVQLLREPFDWAGDALARRAEAGTLDRPSRFGCLAAFAGPAACLALLPLARGGAGESAETVAVFVGGGCVAFAALAVLSDARRYYRRAILPRLAASIRPLGPTAEEVAEILGSIRADRGPLADVADAAEIHRRATDPWHDDGPMPVDQRPNDRTSM